MNIKKIIIYILIAIPLLFLAKCGVESVVYDSNKIPEVNPNPKEKFRIYGNFPYGEDLNFGLQATYTNHNKKCDDVNFPSGHITKQTKQLGSNIKVDRNGTFETITYKDYLFPGVCDWRLTYISLVSTTKSKSIIIEGEQLMVYSRNNGTSYLVEPAILELFKLSNDGKTQNIMIVNCSKSKFKAHKTKIMCEKLHREDVSSLQSEIKIDFID